MNSIDPCPWVQGGGLQCAGYHAVRCDYGQVSSVVSNSAAPWIEAHQASLSITNSRSVLKLMSIQPCFS